MHPLPVRCAALLATLGLLAGCGERAPAPAPDAAAPPAAAPAGAPSGAAMPPHPAPTAAAADVDLTGIPKAEQGQTVAELYAEKAKLSGKPVTVRGKVVKANENVMGTNWVHVRDGSGSEGTNDLTVTTRDAVPPVGSTVLVTGTLSTDKDLGMGYRYEVIVENGELAAE